MQRQALKTIRDEHEVLAAMLHSMRLLLEQQRGRPGGPDFGLLRAMLFYVDEFPNRLHHPKEEALLFPRVRRACPEIGEVLDQLGHDHEQGARSLHHLEHALTAYEMLGEERREAFEHALQRYMTFYLRHMQLEERVVLRAAVENLADADWADLDEAFASNHDPFTGHAPDEAFRPLHARILAALPEPLGYAPAA
jgi:hemerythrin-like domain-containing protein